MFSRMLSLNSFVGLSGYFLSEIERLRCIVVFKFIYSDDKFMYIFVDKFKCKCLYFLFG